MAIGWRSKRCSTCNKKLDGMDAYNPDQCWPCFKEALEAAGLSAQKLANALRALNGTEEGVSDDDFEKYRRQIVSQLTPRAVKVVPGKLVKIPKERPGTMNRGPG